jgi:ankyrin repeat protein
LIEDKKADVNAIDNHGRTVLHTATRQGQLEVVKWLIEDKKADINATDSDGWTVLHSAVRRGQLEVIK